MKPGIAAMKALGDDDHPNVAGSTGFAMRAGNLAKGTNWYTRKALARTKSRRDLQLGALYAAQATAKAARRSSIRIKAGVRASGCLPRSRLKPEPRPKHG